MPEPIDVNTLRLRVEHFVTRMMGEGKAPYSRHAETVARIAAGLEKVAKAAEARGEDHPTVQAARAKLAELAAEAETIDREWLRPHKALAHALALGELVNEWELSGVGTVEIHLPGVVDVSLRLSTPPPF